MWKTAKNKKLVSMVAIGLFASVFIVFSKSLHYGFIRFDDPEYIINNSYVQRGFTWENVKWAFTTGYFSNWHPLTWLSYIAEFHMFGAKGSIYHFNNVLLHAINTVLLFLVFWLMLQQCSMEKEPKNASIWGSAFIAAFFAFHPLRVESVVWVSERKDVLSGMFWLLTMLSYFFYVKKTNWKRYIPVFICTLLGLMSKPMVITLPCALLLLDYWPLRRISFGPGMAKKAGVLIAEKLPLFALSIMSAVITFKVADKALVSLKTFPLSQRLSNSIFAYGCYIGKILWPSKLALIYPYDLDISWWQILTVLVIMFSITIFSIFYYRKEPWLIVGWLWFVGIVFPVCGLFQAGFQLMADRYTYIPSIGIALILYGCITCFIKRIPKIKKITIFSVIVILICLVFTTIEQIKYWRDTPTLFRHTLRVTKKNYLTHYILARSIMFQTKHFEESIYHFKKAAELNFRQSDCYTNIGTIHYNLAHSIMLQPKYFEESIYHFKKAAEYNFRKSDCYTNIGIIHYSNNRIPEAIVHFRRAIYHDDKNALAYYNLGFFLSFQQQYVAAIESFQKAIELKFKIADCHNNIGLIYHKTKQYDRAIVHYQKAIIAQPKRHMTYCNLGATYREKGDYQKAVEIYSEALLLQPNFFKAMFFKGISLSALGKFDEAQNSFQKILQKSPQNEQVLFQSGLTYSKAGKIDEAKKQCNALYQINSNRAQELNDFIENKKQ